MTFSVRADRRFIRTGYRSNRFLLMEVVAPAAVRRETGRPPVNLAFVIDRSGSMQGAKLETAKQAVGDAIARLAPEDRFAIVAYDDTVDIVAESSLATAEARRRAAEACSRITAGNSTNLGEGWLRGCEQVARNLVEGGVNRCLLLTDGLANIGMTDPAELQAHAAELRQRGVATSTFGVGADFDERLLQAMADAGGGHFYFIESAAQIRDAMTGEVGESLDVVARDATLAVTVPEGVTVEFLSPFGSENRGDVTPLRLGDLVSEQQLRTVVRLNFPHGEVGRALGVTVALSDREGGLGAQDPTRITFDYADDRTNDLQPRDVEVDRAVAQAFATRVRLEALELNRNGRFGDAAARLEAVAKRILGYAGSDPDLLRIASELETDRPSMAAPRLAMQFKSAFFSSSAMARGRSVQGKAEKGPGQ
jgi:Ca-activated chloride channel family protein